MTRSALRFALLAFVDTRVRALLVGLLLGTLVHELAAQRPGDAFALAMAFVMVLAGSISFVLHALATGSVRSATPTSRLRGWVLLLGLGLVAGVHGPALLGG